MFQTLSFCFRIGGPPPLIEEILWFGYTVLANLITQSHCDEKCFCVVTYQISSLYVNPFSYKEFLQN